MPPDSHRTKENLRFSWAVQTESSSKHLSDQAFQALFSSNFLSIGDSKRVDSVGVFVKRNKIASFHEKGLLILFVKGMHKNSTIESVYHYFSVFGKVLYLQMPFNKQKKRNIGYCYVVFEDKQSARRVLMQNAPLVLDGKIVQMSEFDIGLVPKKSGSGAAGMILDESFDLEEQKSIENHRYKYKLNESLTSFAHNSSTFQSRANLVPSELGKADLDCSQHSAKPTQSRYYSDRQTAELVHSHPNVVFRVSRYRLSVDDHRPPTSE